MKITKRDGRVVNWDRSKIDAAIIKAGGSLELAVKISYDIEFRGINTVEAIQDEVENLLMSYDPDTAKRYILYREERAKLRRIHPDGRLISEYIHVSKYARHHNGRRETFEETVWRNEQMHKLKYPGLSAQIGEIYDRFVQTKKVLPSMRSMQFGGAAIETHNARMYNCAFSHANRPEFFNHMFYLLLCGCGVGYSVQKQHVSQLEPCAKIDQRLVWHHNIDDTIEGWSDALKALISSYLEPVSHLYSTYVEFNYFIVRPKGSKLKTSGGRAPGHIPLKLGLERVREVLNKSQGRNLKPIDVHDICCIVAETVLSGGIRRSSLISLFSYDDSEMMMAKSGAWYSENSQRAMANNSVVMTRDSYEQFKTVFEVLKENGEPGFFFTENLDFGTNPCGEIGLNPVLEDGRVGFTFCNLTEINGKLIESKDHLLQAARAAAFIGTLQAGYTHLEYLGPVSRRLAERESLLGIGITGIMDRPEILLDGAVLREACEVAVQTNARVARELGLSPASRVTTVKPSGTTSLLLEACGSGIHTHHAKRYFRRVTANPLETAFQYFRSINPHLCEEKPNGDWVIKFPIETNGLTRDEVTEEIFLGHLFNVYDNWVKPGTADSQYSPGLTHNVSCTVTVKDWDLVRRIVWENRFRIAAITFLPYDGGKYAFSPLEVADETWKSLVELTRPVDWTKFHEEEDSTNLKGEGACYGGQCEL